MKFDHFEKDSIYVVRIYENFTNELVNEINQYLKPLMLDIKNNPQAGLLIDMKHVNFIDSARIGLVCNKLLQLKKQDKRFAFSHINETIKDILKRCGLYKTFTIYSTTSEALRLMKTPGAPPTPSPDLKDQTAAETPPPILNSFMRSRQK